MLVHLEIKMRVPGGMVFGITRMLQVPKFLFCEKEWQNRDISLPMMLLTLFKFNFYFLIPIIIHLSLLVIV